jgi:hypothetical protein
MVSDRVHVFGSGDQLMLNPSVDLVGGSKVSARSKVAEREP